MDNIREKLVELLSVGCCPNDGCDFCDYVDFEGCRPHFLADHLIRHGVTVHEWIPVSERLPQEDGSYLVTTNYFGKHQGINIRCFAKDGEAIDKYDLGEEKDVWYDYDSEYGYVSTNSVTHWMPLPEAPKGE